MLEDTLVQVEQVLVVVKLMDLQDQVEEVVVEHQAERQFMAPGVVVEVVALD